MGKKELDKLLNDPRLTEEHKKLLEKYRCWSEDLARRIRENKDPICFSCGRIMIKAYDSIAKKKTGYLWTCDCKAMKGKSISIG